MYRRYPTPPREYLLTRFRYDEEAGELLWLPNPSFAKTWNTRYANTRAGTLSSDGYLNVCLTYDGKKRSYGVHVIAFKMKMGRDAQSIGHVDGVKDNNRWSNLREGGVLYHIRQFHSMS